MTGSQFQVLCGKYLIDMNIALENENILYTLQNRKSLFSSWEELYNEIERILKEEF